ncbi:hypothetical protein IT408_03960 [Candidatus Uhrbacteria bacterium]|nr:hypothetical protein [Candidatus Uhrbacteria bacterium]
MGWKQKLRDKKAKERLQALEDQKIESIKEQLAILLEKHEFSTEYENSNGTHDHFMRRLQLRMRRAIEFALRSYTAVTKEAFTGFRDVFNAFCRHTLMLKTDASEYYIERELRHALDKKLSHFSGILRALDKKPVDAKTYEAILTKEIASILRIDMEKIALGVIRAVELRLVELAQTGLPVCNRSTKGYEAVMCLIGTEKRTKCFLILDKSKASGVRIVALQTPRKFKAHQKKVGKSKGDITKGRQRYSNIPQHLRHLFVLAPESPWTSGVVLYTVLCIFIVYGFPHFYIF